MTPVARSATCGAGRSDLRAQANSCFALIDLEHHGQGPRREIGGKCHLGQGRAPVLREVERFDRPAIAAVAVEFEKAARQRLAGHDLVFGIERRSDRQAAVVELVLAIELQEFAAHLLGEGFSREEPGARLLDNHAQRFRLIFLRLFFGDVAVLGHAAQHPIAPLDGLLLLLEGMVIVGSLGKGSEIGHLVDTQLVKGLAEIVESGGRDAIGVQAEENLIEIELEDLVLGEGLLDALGEERLLELALGGLLARQKEVFGDLLGNGGGANQLAAAAAHAGLQVHHNGATDALPVQAGMVIEVLVFGRQESRNHLLGHGADRHEETAFLCIFRDERTVGGMYPRHHRGLVACELLEVGEIFLRLPNNVASPHGQTAEDDETACKQKAQKSKHVARLPCWGPLALASFLPSFA